MNPTELHRDRATILFQQRRYADAERELRAALSHNPDDAILHALLALTLAHLRQLAEASAEADRAVGLGPDLAFAHYARASVLHDRERPAEAEQAARQAVALDPHDARPRALLAAAVFAQRRWADALAEAEAGLAVDPAHDGCANLRAMALVQLGRKDEAGAAIDGMLARDPDNAVSHANQGWTLLHRGDHAKALEHFREALRLDPNQEWARSGVVEALKARHLVYRLMLKYFLWSGRLGRGAQWGLIVGGYVGQQVLRSIARTNPAAAPFVVPLIALYSAFVVLTWLADPLFNLLLRLNRFGRLALGRRQTWGANALAALLASALAALVVGLARGGLHGAGYPWFVLAAVFGILSVPTSTCFKLPAGWPTAAMAVGTSALALVGFAVAGTWFAIESATDADRVSQLLRQSDVLQNVFLVGFLASQFAANALATAQPKR